MPEPEGHPETEEDGVLALLKFGTRSPGEEFRPADALADLGGDPGMLPFFLPWGLHHGKELRHSKR